MQKFEFGVSDDGKAVLQRVSEGRTQVTVAIPLTHVEAVTSGLLEAKREAVGKIIVPGSNVEFKESATTPPPEGNGKDRSSDPNG